MITKTVSCRRFVLLGLFVAAFAVTGLVRADDLPTFSDPDVTAYVKDYSTFADRFSAEMKDYKEAVKSGDSAKMQAAAAKMQPEQAKAQEMATKSATISGKIKPDEAQKFSSYMLKCAQKISDASK